MLDLLYQFKNSKRIYSTNFNIMLLMFRFILLTTTIIYCFSFLTFYCKIKLFNKIITPLIPIFDYVLCYDVIIIHFLKFINIYRLVKLTRFHVDLIQTVVLYSKYQLYIKEIRYLHKSILLWYFLPILK